MIEPTIFGNSSVGPVEGLTQDPAEMVGKVQPSPIVDTPTGALLQGSEVAAEAKASTLAADRERATMLESAGAAVSLWIGKGIYDRTTAPADVPEDGYKFSEALKHVPFKMSEDEFDWLKGAKSTDGFTYRKDYIEQKRMAQQAMGDHPLVGMAVSMVDPAFLVATPLTAGVVKVAKGGRAMAAVASAGTAVGATLAAEGPVNDQELVLNGLVNFAAGAMIFKPGKGMIKADADFPDEALTKAATEMGQPGTIRMRPDGIPERVPLGNEVADPVVRQANSVKVVDNALGGSLGERLQWNMRKTMSNFGPSGKKVADLLFDNNSDLSMNSVEAHRAAVRSDLTGWQHVYEDALRDTMAADGHGLFSRINPFTSGKASMHQAKLEKEVQLEMFRREQLQRQGRPISYDNVRPEVKTMADALDNLHGIALKELKAAGVEGAEDLVQKAGWHHRKWSSAKIEEVTAKFKAAGLDDKAAHQEVVKLVQTSLRNANGWDAQLAYDIGAAIVNRAQRKGYFEDALFNAPAGEGALKQFRDLLKAEGVTGQRLERILDVMRQQTDDAGKVGFMKHRVDLDYSVETSINGQKVGIADLLDTRMTTIVDQYLDGVSTQVAFARKGLRKVSDIEDLRNELSHSIADPAARKNAVELFDNTINHMKGLPAGQSVNDGMRLMSAYGRMIALANSGLWQATEYASMMGQYGLLKTMKYAMAEMPGLKGLMETAAKDRRVSRHLKDILSNHSDQNLRLRPFVHRFEDNFVIGANDAMHLSAQQAGQIVPYVNVMKYIHGHQARVASNLILNRLEMAANGNAKAITALQKYGIESHVVDRLKAAFKQHGADVDKWDDAVWRSTRPAFMKMMDEAVLHQRLGDMPAFAAFDQVGKFVFTYRSFVLSAHNKILAGGMARNGSGAVALMMAYQFPLAAMAVQAQSVINGKGTLSDKDMALKAFGQMGALGMFGEITSVASGQKGSFGAPGLIPIDRAYALTGSVASGNWEKAGGDLYKMMPILGVATPLRGFSNLDK